MLDRSRLSLPSSRGVRRNRRAYERDFYARYSGISGRASWKFERQQYFEEPGHPGWEAFHQGRWEEALGLLEGERENHKREAREDEAQGRPFHRVRIVEQPLTPYLQWELHALRIQAEAGERIRVLPADEIRFVEQSARLPEVVVLGGEVLYEVCYTEAGVLDGCVLFTDNRLIVSWERFIAELFDKGEEMTAYARRYLDHLPPPRLTG
jgi:hypothetical protein